MHSETGSLPGSMPGLPGASRVELAAATRVSSNILPFEPVGAMSWACSGRESRAGEPNLDVRAFQDIGPGRADGLARTGYGS
jgi:hypothetical protein